jgi:hypothetical protein
VNDQAADVPFKGVKERKNERKEIMVVGIVEGGGSGESEGRHG